MFRCFTMLIIHAMSSCGARLDVHLHIHEIDFCPYRLESVW